MKKKRLLRSRSRSKSRSKSKRAIFANDQTFVSKDEFIGVRRPSNPEVWSWAKVLRYKANQVAVDVKSTKGELNLTIGLSAIRKMKKNTPFMFFGTPGTVFDHKVIDMTEEVILGGFH
jgi:hypothetical protein